MSSNWFNTIINSAATVRHFLEDDVEDFLILDTTQQGNMSSMRGSRPGRSPNVNRSFSSGHNQIYNDYFTENCTYSQEAFQRRYRIPRDLFLKIMNDLQTNYEYFRLRCDATGKPGLSTLQKCTSAIRLLAYGSSADSIDENIRIGTSTALETLRYFCTGIIEMYSSEYLRPPNAEECSALMTENSGRGFPGMVASIDCMHWRWSKCPVAWKGQYQGKDGKPSVVLEACASHDTYIWHCFFGSPGTLNDLNILDRSPLLNDVIEHSSLGRPWAIGGHQYERGYLLADGIYPDWSIFVKTITNPQTTKEKLFAKTQEAVRKDVERAFGILQAMWKIIENPCRLFDVQTMEKIITTCIILHNMRIRNRNQHTTHEEAESVGRHAVNRNDELSDFMNQRSTIKDQRLHQQLRRDLIDHLWALKGDNIE